MKYESFWPEKVIVVNRTLQSLHGASLDIKPTVLCNDRRRLWFSQKKTTFTIFTIKTTFIIISPSIEENRDNNGAKSLPRRDFSSSSGGTKTRLLVVILWIGPKARALKIWKIGYRIAQSILRMRLSNCMKILSQILAHIFTSYQLPVWNTIILVSNAIIDLGRFILLLERVRRHFYIIF